MKTKLQKATYWTSVSVIGIVVGISLQFVKAWTEPTQIAPNSNVGAPITTSGNPQIKSGPLNLGSYLTTVGGVLLNSGAGSPPALNGLLVPNGNVGIGTVSPTQKLDVNGNIGANDVYIGAAGKWASQIGNDNLGNHTATQDLNMNGKNVANAGQINASSVKFSDGSTQTTAPSAANLTGAWMGNCVSKSNSCTSKSPAYCGGYVCTCPGGYTLLKYAETSNNVGGVSIFTSATYTCMKN